VYGAFKAVDSDYASVLYVGEASINIPFSYVKGRYGNDTIKTVAVIETMRRDKLMNNSNSNKLKSTFWIVGLAPERMMTVSSLGFMSFSSQEHPPLTMSITT